MGWRKKLTPIPVSGSNSLRMVASRSAGLRAESTAAEESVMEAPKPSMVWYVVSGSITIVGCDEAADPNGTGACSARS